MSESESVRARIRLACTRLLESGELVTRNSIASLAGCSIRTVSYHKDLWKDFAAVAHDENISSAEYVSASLRNRVERIEGLILKESDLEDLESYISTIKWFRLLVLESPKREELKDLVDKLNEMENQIKSRSAEGTTDRLKTPSFS